MSATRTLYTLEDFKAFIAEAEGIDVDAIESAIPDGAALSLNKDGESEEVTDETYLFQVTADDDAE